MSEAAATNRSPVSCQNVTTGRHSTASSTSGPRGSRIQSGSDHSVVGDHHVTPSDACWTYTTRGVSHVPGTDQMLAALETSVPHRTCAPSSYTGEYSSEPASRWVVKSVPLGVKLGVPTNMAPSVRVVMSCRPLNAPCAPNEPSEIPNAMSRGRESSGCFDHASYTAS
ncbi:hypothetical protein D3C74_343890 [compost metagenome]